MANSEISLISKGTLISNSMSNIVDRNKRAISHNRRYPIILSERRGLYNVKPNHKE
jgi:hypothetical protein